MLLHNQYEFNPDTDLIAKGGFAEVFKAYDRNLDIFVAIKRFNTDAGSRGSVIKEIRKSIGFQHPNIIRYFNCFTREVKDALGRTITEEYGVMDYANAGSLSDIISGKRKVSTEDFKDIILGILDGLHYLHTLPTPIIHRDLKPSNILLQEQGGKLIPKICDFGISKEWQDATTTGTMTGMVGTMEYMSPEQIAGKGIQPNTDLWALGCIIYEYFAGQPPFGKVSRGTSIPALNNNILNATYNTPEFNKIPEPFEELVKASLHKEPSKRLKYAEEGKKILLGKRDYPDGGGKRISLKVVKSLLFISSMIILIGVFYRLSTKDKFKSTESTSIVSDANLIEVDTLETISDLKPNKTEELDIEKPQVEEIVSSKVNELSSIDKRLLGKHLFSCHWISWETFGYAIITKDTKGRYELKANQTVGSKYFKMDGELFPKTEFEFDFVGKIVTNIHDSLGHCEESGRYSFFRYYDHQRYWRMKEGYMGEDLSCNPTYGTYVDIFFK